jgi:hypothetical protein
MARRVDPSLTKRALSALARAAQKAQATPEGLSDWEAEFLASVQERLTTYGSAFADPDKGQLSAPLSLRQGLKVRQIGKKGDAPKPKPDADPKQKTALGRKSGLTQTGFKSPASKPTGLKRTGFKKKP